MKFANEEERRRYFRELGRKGGKTTAEKYGSEHMAKIGRKGFEVTTKKYFQGDKSSHRDWLVKCGLFNYWHSTNIPMKYDFMGNPIRIGCPTHNNGL